MLEVEPQVVADYIVPGRVRMVYRHLAQVGESSIRAAEAAECAADQGRFWEMRAMLYERQIDLLQTATLDGGLLFLARELDLDEAQFSACLQEHTHREVVLADSEASREAGVVARPTFEIDGERLIGFRSPDDVRAFLDQALSNE